MEEKSSKLNPLESMRSNVVEHLHKSDLEISLKGLKNSGLEYIKQASIA
jgi:hypothetical protein